MPQELSTGWGAYRDRNDSGAPPPWGPQLKGLTIKEPSKEQEEKRSSDSLWREIGSTKLIRDMHLV